MSDVPRRFDLLRFSDPSGVSGTGKVAQGVEWSPGGGCVLRWLGPSGSVCVWESVESMLRVHGHEGQTRVEWVD